MPVAAPVASATRELVDDMEVTVCIAPRSLLTDLRAVLPALPTAAAARLLVVPVCQRARLDLLNVGADVAAEKDRCLLRFIAFARATRDVLLARAATASDSEAGGSAWCDFVDPCSGLPAHSPAASPYPEVDAIEVLLRYRTEIAGACRVLMHPAWGGRVYPATIFTTAPLDALLAALDEGARAVRAFDAEEASGAATAAGAAPSGVDGLAPVDLPA